ESPTLAVSGEADRVVDRMIASYADEGTRTIELTVALPTTWWQFTFVRDDTMLPSRSYLVPPPEGPPPGIPR
ncbi:MAG TPA: hypothetical protein VIV40_02265, partial [Kofleriaceae bacterium]